VLIQPRDPITLRADVSAMRERMAQNLGIKRPGHFDIKHGRGGMIDIEFLVQYAVLRTAHAHPELARWSDNIRQLEGLAQAGELDAGTAAFLAEAYRTYRRRVHACALQEIPGVVQGDEWHDTRTRVIALWQQMMTDPPATATGNLAQARNRHGTQRH
jgi:glutamate-ammonia-ligase adenylyltransferase